jgi:hypothetical protein
VRGLPIGTVFHIDPRLDARGELHRLARWPVQPPPDVTLIRVARDSATAWAKSIPWPSLYAQNPAAVVQGSRPHRNHVPLLNACNDTLEWLALAVYEGAQPLLLLADLRWPPAWLRPAPFRFASLRVHGSVQAALPWAEHCTLLRVRVHGGGGWRSSDWWGDQEVNRLVNRHHAAWPQTGNLEIIVLGVNAASQLGLRGTYRWTMTFPP